MPSRVLITVVKLSGESRTFEMKTHNSITYLLDQVEWQMVPKGMRFKLVMGDLVIDPENMMPFWPPGIEFPPGSGYFTDRPTRIELRHLGIYEDTTLTLVIEPRRER